MLRGGLSRLGKEASNYKLLVVAVVIVVFAWLFFFRGGVSGGSNSECSATKYMQLEGLTQNTPVATICGLTIEYAGYTTTSTYTMTEKHYQFVAYYESEGKSGGVLGQTGDIIIRYDGVSTSAIGIATFDTLSYEAKITPFIENNTPKIKIEL